MFLYDVLTEDRQPFVTYKTLNNSTYCVKRRLRALRKACILIYKDKRVDEIKKLQILALMNEDRNGSKLYMSKTNHIENVCEFKFSERIINSCSTCGSRLVTHGSGQSLVNFVIKLIQNTTTSLREVMRSCKWFSTCA